MAARFRVSASASQQLDEIYRYTRRTWTDAQANKYLDGLFDHFDAIASGKIKGRLVQAEYGVTGYCAPYERHVVYWKLLADGTVGIAEILHVRMNAGDRLAASEMLNREE